VIIVTKPGQFPGKAARGAATEFMKANARILEQKVLVTSTNAQVAFWYMTKTLSGRRLRGIHAVSEFEQAYVKIRSSRLPGAPDSSAEWERPGLAETSADGHLSELLRWIGEISWNQAEEPNFVESSRESPYFPVYAAIQVLRQEFHDIIEESSVREAELKDVRRSLLEANQKLDRLAHTDSLTGLSNRRGIEKDLQDTASNGSLGQVTAILVDLDDFKQINDSYGHASGDAVLRDLGRRIRAIVPSEFSVGRIGGDEFLVFMPGAEGRIGLEVAERIRLAISEDSFRTLDGAIGVTVSAGIATLQGRVRSLEEILTATRIGLNTSKESGKNCVGLSPADSELCSTERVFSSIVEKLRNKSNFRAVAQPILDIRSSQVVGYELLSRGKENPFKMPADFFRISLERDLLTSVDLGCLEVCLAEAASRELTGRLHVNIFPSTLLSTPVERLLAALPKQLEPSRVCVELSEQQVFGDPGVLIERVGDIRDMGMSIAMDDVGFGRTSLETLLLLEPDVIKIDRSCVDGVALDPVKRRYLRRMVKTMNSLGAELVAEGIEHDRDLQVLRELDFKFAQGFHLGVPN
jgi:diguanylate cyclase (GGDEF)-like protein